MSKSARGARRWIARAAAAAVAVVTTAAVAHPLVASAASHDGRHTTRGVPWTGPMGVTETVGEVMARPRRATGPRAAPPVGPVPSRRPSPVGGARAASSATSGAAARPGPRLSVSTSFLGVTLGDSGFVPPDSEGAAGPTQVLVPVNGWIRTFDKHTGIADGALDTTITSFYAPLLGGGLDTSDPRVRYDRITGRWIMTMISVDPLVTIQPANRVLVAVSSGSTISSSSSFTLFQFKQDSVTPVGNDAGCFADFDTLGVDVSALYVGANFFCSNGTNLVFTDAGEFVIRKSSVLGAGPIVVTAFRNLTNGASAGPISPQGADNDDPTANTGYVIGVDVGQFGHLVLRRITTPGTTPAISDNIDIPVAATTAPINVPHLNSDGRPLDGIDDRLVNAVVRNGTIWTAHNIQVDATGAASSSGGRNGSRWYQIQGLTTTPSVAQFGTVFDPGASSPLSYWLPSLNVSLQGHMAIAGSLAGAAHYADAWAASHLLTDPGGTTGAPVQFTTSANAYNPTFGFPDDPHRWGDYSFTSLDPDDGMSMWTAQEYTDSANSWGVRVGLLLAPPPATPAIAVPAGVPAGIASVNVVIAGPSGKGMGGDGSGFFDPGPGYAKRIGAAVGGGVVVNSVRYDDPARVVLNLDTTHASTGAQNVTITNPDGQSATGAGVLTIMPAAGSLRATTAPALPSQIMVDGTAADSWGLTWLHLAAGDHSVAYSHVEGYTEPAPQTATITAGGTTTIAGAFTQRGSLHVTTSPAVPGAISVDGVVRNDWGLWTDLPTGSHQVCFGPAADFTPPPCQTVSLTAGTVTAVTGTYTSTPGAPGPSGTGQLRVTTSPALPSQILVDGTPADSWGLNWVDLAPGTHTVSFTHVEGYTEPAPQTVTVVAGATTTLAGTFIQRASLRVMTSPAEPGTITVDGIPRNDWGMWTDVPAGAHMVCFGWAPTAVAPDCQPVTLTAGTLTTVTGTYTAGP